MVSVKQFLEKKTGEAFEWEYAERVRFAAIYVWLLLRLALFNSSEHLGDAAQKSTLTSRTSTSGVAEKGYAHLSSIKL